MATYRSYEAVKAVQAWLETARDAGVFDFDGTLKKSSDLDPFVAESYDGKWGPDTDRVFLVWLDTQPVGTSLATLAEYSGLTTDETRTLKQAVLAYREGGVKPTPEPKPPEPEPKPTYYAQPQPVQRAGFSGWILAGVLVMGLGLGWVATRRVR